MLLEKLLEIEAQQEFEDVNAIRRSRIHSFMDEWVVTDLLGRGSFGNVYRIVKPQPGIKNQECALKICQVNNPEDAELISQEIKMQMALSGHPNAVQIEDYALISREPPRVSYLLIRMELLSPLPAEGLSERETVQLGIDICGVLEKCASMEPKLVHCDIKPANILVSTDGRYKLGDFGTAKTLQATMTYTGNRGTPMYMAPEVASYTGYDSRCDIFSLGYTMLTMLNGGRHPYETSGDRSDILRAMYETKKLPQIKGVSSGLLKIIRKMCEPNLNARYSRASEVKRDLELFVRKKAEAEKLARLEAERQAEVAKKKARAEREKNLKLASNAVVKAENELIQAQDELVFSEIKDKYRIRKKIRLLEASLDRATRTRQYVADGATYNDALKEVRDEDAVLIKQKYLNYFISNKHRLISFSAIGMLFIISVVCTFFALSGSNTSNKEPYNENAKLENGYMESVIESKSDKNDPSYFIADEVQSDYDSSDTELPYLIEVDKTKNVVSIYTTDENGKLTSLNRQMICSTEVTEGTIPDGVYQLSTTGRRFEWYSIIRNEKPLYTQYACDTSGEFMLQSVPYEINGDKSSLVVQQYEKLGTSSAGFCIFLTVEGAKWIYDNCPPGTPVHIMCSSEYDAELIDALRPASPIDGWDPTDPDPDNPAYMPICDNSLNVETKDGFILSLNADRTGYKVVDYVGGNGFNVVLPSEYNGRPITEIGKGAFNSYFNTFSIPDSVTSIGDYAFAGCSNLRTINIPNSVTFIGDCAFSGCPLEEINIQDINFTYFNRMLFTKDMTTLVLAPKDISGRIQLPYGVVHINGSAFENCGLLKSVELPKSLISIGDGAFSGCGTLTSIYMPDSITSIGVAAFDRCNSMNSIWLSAGITSIEDGTFYNCSSLTSIVIPDGVASIGENAFFSCDSLGSISIPESVTLIGNNAFKECDILTISAPHDPEYYGTNLGDYKEWITQ